MECVLRTANLVYITSFQRHTREYVNHASRTALVPGLPSPALVMSINTVGLYIRRVDSADRADWFGVGITAGPPVRFTVQTDTFRPVSGCCVNGGTGYVVGDIITLPPLGLNRQSVPHQLRLKLSQGQLSARFL